MMGINFLRSSFSPRCRVRNLLGWYEILNGVGRIAVTWLAPGCCTLSMPTWLYGGLYVFCGIWLLATTRCRQSLGGRLAAAVSVGLLTYIAIDAWPVAHHALTYGLFAGVMILEAWKPRI